MDLLRDIVAFKAGQFAPVLPDDCQVNPGVYGAELAFWLAQALARIGIPTSYPSDEDWGWFIEYVSASGSEFAVHCSNVEGAKDRWLLSLRRFPRKMFGRDKPRYSEAIALVKGIHVVVNAAVPAADVSWLWVDDAVA